jgi:hypothetical protein
MQLLAAGDREQAPGEVGTAHGGPLGGLDALPGDRMLPDGAFEQVEVADDYPQQIIEVMRQAPGQLPDGLHLLGVPQLLVHLLLRGNVPRNSGSPKDTALWRRDRRHGE